MSPATQRVLLQLLVLATSQVMAYFLFKQIVKLMEPNADKKAAAQKTVWPVVQSIGGEIRNRYKNANH